MNKKQIVILWISLSIILPILFFGGKRIIDYNSSIQSYKIDYRTIPLPKEEDLVDVDSEQGKRLSQAWQLMVEKDKFIKYFCLTVFEFISVAGLLIFIFHRRKESKNI